MREPAQLLIDRTEGIPPLAAPNSYGKFALARLNHIEGDLTASEKGFQEIVQTTSDWKVWTNSVTKIFEGYASMLRTAGRDEEALLKDAHALGIKTELPKIEGFTGPFKLDASYKHFATEASDEATDAAFYHKPYPDGFFDHGTLVDFTGEKPTITVIDRQKDPLIQDLLARTTKAFDADKLTPEQTATALAEYTRRLFPNNQLAAYYAFFGQHCP
ncbi:MAG: hypothetical protein P4L53_18475 [Candidatus Obscuribacterales bacterium]|nr:hypothetical protein [Candidatus Obscuribacterales bacterium]